jgi:hypothetical protein
MQSSTQGGLVQGIEGVLGFDLDWRGRPGVPHSGRRSLSLQGAAHHLRRSCASGWHQTRGEPRLAMGVSDSDTPRRQARDLRAAPFANHHAK